MAEIPYSSAAECSSAVKCLMYAMVLTRPNLSFIVNVMSRYMVNPGKAHWKIVMWILRYLNGTIDSSLMYRTDKESVVSVEGFVDTDYA